MLIFKGVFSTILFNFQLVHSTKVPSKTKKTQLNLKTSWFFTGFPRDLPISEAISRSTFLTPGKAWNNNPIPLWKLSCFIFEHVNTKGRRNFILEKQPLSGWGHDHPSSANVPWSSGRVCRCVVPLSTVEVLFLFLDLFSEIFLSQLLYECSDRPTSPRMNPNSWRRVIVICALLSACESGLQKEIITH